MVQYTMTSLLCGIIECMRHTGRNSAKLLNAEIKIVLYEFFGFKPTLCIVNSKGAVARMEVS